MISDSWRERSLLWNDRRPRIKKMRTFTAVVDSTGLTTTTRAAYIEAKWRKKRRKKHFIRRNSSVRMKSPSKWCFATNSCKSSQKGISEIQDEIIVRKELSQSAIEAETIVQVWERRSLSPLLDRGTSLYEESILRAFSLPGRQKVGAIYFVSHKQTAFSLDGGESSPVPTDMKVTAGGPTYPKRKYVIREIPRKCLKDITLERLTTSSLQKLGLRCKLKHHWNWVNSFLPLFYHQPNCQVLVKAIMGEMKKKFK